MIIEKKTYLFLTTLCVLITLFFNTCRKYPDGSWLMYSSKNLFGENKNTSAKEWGLKLYEVNGIDSTDLIPGTNSIPNFYTEFVSFKVSDIRSLDFDATTYLYFYYGTLYKKEKKLFIGLTDASFGFNTNSQCTIKNSVAYCERNIFAPENNKGVLWDIKKLTANELVITFNSINTYKIILKSN